MSFSVKTLALFVAAVAIAISLLRYANSTTVVVVDLCYMAFLLIAVSLAVGCAFPARAFWLTVLVVAVVPQLVDAYDLKYTRYIAPTRDWLQANLLLHAVPQYGSSEEMIYRVRELDDQIMQYRYSKTGRLNEERRFRDDLYAKMGFDKSKLDAAPDSSSFRQIYERLFTSAVSILCGAVAYIAASRSNSNRGK